MVVVLVKSIHFVDFENNSVTIPANTKVYVDTDESIAFVNGYHFDIDADEYSVSN